MNLLAKLHRQQIANNRQQQQQLESFQKHLQSTAKKTTVL